MELHSNLPETLTRQFPTQLDQSADIMASGLDESNQSALPTQSVPDILDFLSDLQQRRDWVRQVLSDQASPN